MGKDSKTKYVVLMRSSCIRDAQFLDTNGLSDDEFYDEELDLSSDEDLWCDLEADAFIGIFEAESQDDACKMTSAETRFDSRSLYAIEV